MRKVKITAFIFVICSALSAFGQRKNLIFESTFESPLDLTHWYERSLFSPWSGQLDYQHKRSGNSGFKLELNRSKDDLSKGPRAEIGMGPQAKDEFWYGFSNYFPSEYQSDPATEIVNQWQAFPDVNLGEGWRSPPLDLEIKADRFKIAIRSSSQAVNSNDNANVDYLDIGPVDHNKWTDWVFHVKWSYNSGTLEVWKNGRLILSRKGKPIGYNDLHYPYFKAGIYKWEWNNPNTNSTSTDRVYYIDEIRVGNSAATYSDVAPDGSTAILLPITPNTLKIVSGKAGSYTVSFVASKTINTPSKFILYLSSDSGGTYKTAYSSSNIKLVENVSYKINFSVQ